MDATARRLHIAHALAERRASLGIELHGTRLSFPLGSSRIHVELGAADAAGAFARSVSASMRYRIEGTLGASEARAREVLLGMARDLVAIDDAIGTGEANVDPALLAAPSTLVAMIDGYHREALRTRTSVDVIGLPPCLDLAMRPESPRASIANVVTPLATPCDECGVATVCPSSAFVPTDSPRALRPLRHAESLAATLAAVRAIAASWDAPAPRRIEETLLDLVASRAGVLGVAPVPFELSLKVMRDRVVPIVRVVEYSPRSALGMPSRAERAPRRRRALERAASTWLDEPGRDAMAHWLDMVEASQPPGLELSIGFEDRLDASDSATAQIYAHIEPRARPATRSLLRRMLGWSGASDAAIKPIAALLDRDDIELTLVSSSPAPGDPRRTKAYFAVPSSLDDAASGLARASLGTLADLAPPWGLAVLECGAKGARWHKYDFPCLPHFQRLPEIVGAFAEGLAERERARLESLLDGTRFAAWPTWMSVSPEGRAFYFVPR